MGRLVIVVNLYVFVGKTRFMKILKSPELSVESQKSFAVFSGVGAEIYAPGAVSAKNMHQASAC